MKKACLFFSFILIGYLANSQQLPAPTRLRCDFLLNAGKVSKNGMPVNESLAVAVNKKDEYQFPKVYNQQPVFTWETDTSIKQVSAWRILVASSVSLLNNNKANYWDSKKTVSPHCRTIYSGKQLQPGNIYYWKVCAWDEKNKQTSFSQIASFFLAAKEPGEDISHYPLAADMQTATSILKKDDGAWFLDFGKDAFAQLQLHLTSDKDDSIWIEAAEALESPQTILRTKGNIRYIKTGLFVKKGTHDYHIEWPANEKRNSRNPIQMPDYIGEVFPFRYVNILNFTGTIHNNSIKRKAIHYPFDESASYFISSDTVLNKVWELCKYSMKATSFTGHYVDGDRERVPYEADALINQLSYYSVDAEYTIARRSLDYLVFHPTWPTEWSLQNIFIAWNDYLYTGNDFILKKYYTELQHKSLTDLAAGNGLISTRTGKQTSAFLASIHFPESFDNKEMLKDNVDWPQKGEFIGNEKEYGGETDGFVYNDYNSVINAWYCKSLLLMKEIASVLHKNEDAAFYEAKAKQVFRSFQLVFKDPATGLIKDGDSTDHHSLHANMFALAFDLIPEENKETVIRFIKTRKMACSVYGSQFLLDALYDNNEGDYALTLLNATTERSWYNMIRSGSTISMEAWDKKYKPNLDWNHAWGAAPGNIIVRKLMGIEPLTPGFETFRIKPQIGDLDFVNLKTPTIKGDILVSYKKEAAQDKMDVIIPGSTHAEIYLPYDPEKPVLLIDGKVIKDKPRDGFFIIKNMAAGKHILVMK